MKRLRLVLGLPETATPHALRHGYPSPGRFAARTLGKRCRPSGYFEWPGPRPGRPPMPPNEDSRTGTLLSFLKVIIVPIP